MTRIPQYEIRFIKKKQNEVIQKLNEEMEQSEQIMRKMKDNVDYKVGAFQQNGRTDVVSSLSRASSFSHHNRGFGK